MKIRGVDEYDDIALAVGSCFPVINVVELGNFDCETTYDKNGNASIKPSFYHTKNPFAPRDIGIIYPIENIADDFRIALDMLYAFFPELRGCPTVFRHDTIISKIEKYEGFMEVFGGYSKDKLVYKYRAVSDQKGYRVVENTRAWWKDLPCEKDGQIVFNF